MNTLLIVLFVYVAALSAGLTIYRWLVTWAAHRARENGR